MRLSVLDLVPVFAGADSTEALKQAIKLAQTADSLGYHRYWAAEHHDMQALACTSPEVLLAHVGALTERIRLGSGALLLPHYRPIKVAESYHLLAALCPGRIDLGLGRAPGGSAEVSIALSGNFLENVRQLPDKLKALMELLSHEHRVEGARVTARPVPPSPPEVWMLGTNNKSAAYAAEFGTGYVFGQFMSHRNAADILPFYKERFQPSALLTEPRVIAAVGVVCADTEEEAQRLAVKAASTFAADSRGPTEAHVEITTESHKLIVGTANQVKACLVRYGQQYGVDEFLVVTMVPDYDKRLRSYELLAGAALS
ncbi:LLM class flavin-dependent oxidoreductase [Paenibacillus xerothermodurans]|uniref:LLM class flavin-dependent oxidoreductase n=1 Tax=Paenibacillus xerothermodurans TaxID=1977292 RepID=UPI001FB26D56|nr:LLM class flavin-dependent oxidoreductase [Paenibacillus xerothermodurans]